MNAPTARLARLCAFTQRLGEDRSGVSMLEFALVLPVLLTLGFYGTEVAYMATVNMQIGQMASSVADNASRLGQTDNSSITPTVTQAQIDSVMKGALVQGESFDFENNGRVILSSLEKDPSTGRQYIHWQRCRGKLKVASQYGRTGTGQDGPVLAGMGKSEIKAAANSAVMYVEVSYDYKPLFGSMFVAAPRFRREAAFIIRDDRNLTPGITPSNTDTSCT